MRRNGVGQASWLINAGNGGQNFRRNFFVQFDVLIKLLHDRAAQGFNFTALLGLLGSQFNWQHAGHEVDFAVNNGFDFGALLTFNQDLDGAIGQFEHLQNGRDATDFEHVGGLWLIFGCCFLGHQHDAAIGEHGTFKRFDAFGATHKERDDHVRKDHDIAQWQHRQVN